MADVVYGVEVNFIQSGALDKSVAGLGKLQGATDKWTKSMFSGVSDFAGTFNGALDAIGSKVVGLGMSAAAGLSAAAGTGLAFAAKTAFEFNEQMENSTIAMAALANANGMADGIGNGMRLAGDVLKDMRKDAAALPGEFKDLVNIMTTISGATGNAGMGLHATESLAKDTMATAAVLGVPQQVAAREMSMMLEGNARHSMPMFAKLHMGMDTKEFNKLDPRARLDVVRESLGKFAPAVELYKNSWEAIRTTTVDNVRAAAGAVGMPLFTTAKEKLKEFNDSFSKDPRKKEQFQHIGEVLATGLDRAFTESIDAVKHWYPVVETFAENMFSRVKSVWERLGPVIHGALGKLEDFMMDPGAFDKVIEAGKTYAELRAGGAALQGGSALLGSEAGSAALAGLGAEGIIATGGALAVLAIAAEGATSAYLDQTSVFHGAAEFLVNDIMGAGAAIFANLKQIGSDLQPIADAFGIVLLGAVDVLAGGLEWLTSGVKELTNAFADTVKWLRNITGTMAEDKPEAILRTQELFPIKTMDTLTAVREKERKVPTNVTHVHRVDIHVNSNQDPNRIAKRTADVLSDLARHPKVATQTGAPVLSR